MATSVDLNVGFIEEEMERMEMTKKQLVELSGLTYGIISRALEKGSTSEPSARALEDIFGDNIYARTDDPYGIIRRFSEAEQAGSTYRLVRQRYVFQVGIDHPDGTFLVRCSTANQSKAEKALRAFNKNDVRSL